MARTAVIGAGSWGTALAKLLGDAGHEVALWSHNPVVARQIAEQGENREYLPGAKLPETIWVTTELGAALSDAQFVIAVVPSHAFRTVMERAAPNIPAEALIVTATKGIEVDTLKRPSEIITGLLPNHPPPAMLSGPSFAQETAEGDPTAVVIASRDVDVANRAQELFTTDRFRVYTNDDILGVEIADTLPEWQRHHREVAVGDGIDVDLDSAAFAPVWNEGWPTATSGVVVGFRVESRDAVDRLHARVLEAGHRSQQEPSDAFWGARYAVVEDPGGTAIGIMSPVDDARRKPPPTPPS